MTNSNPVKDVESQILGFFDRNIRIIQYSVYAVGVIGLVAIAKSARIFSKFTCAKDVPREFITKSVKLQGRIEAVELVHLPNHQDGYTVRLDIEHIPVATVKWGRKRRQPSPLRIELLGVWPSLEGVNQWVRPAIHSSPAVWFQLYGINEEENLLYASVLLKRAWWKLWSEKDLSLIILKKNAGRVSSYLPSRQHIYLNDRYPTYYRKLLFCEIRHSKSS